MDEIPKEVRESLPEEVRAELERREEARKIRNAALTVSLSAMRRKAVDYRANLGIEQEWAEAEDAYEGIDDANRATENTASSRAHKPRSDGGSVTSRVNNGTRSTVFLNITASYTDAAAARVANIMLPTDDRNFSIQPTPIPELSQMAEDEEQLLEEDALRLGVKTFGDIAKRHIEDAKTRSEAAQKRIDDWLVECQFSAELRKVIDDCAKLGSGVLKGPVPSVRKLRKATRTNGAIALEISEVIAPESVRVDPWNLFPDPSCGESITNGSYLFERVYMSPRQVRELVSQEGYDSDELQAALDEGPSKINIVSTRKATDDDRFEAWYFYGQISAEDFESTTKKSSPTPEKFIDVCCMLINDRMVKVTQSHLDSGEFPYDLLAWRRRAGMPWGIGVPKQISVPQRMLVAGSRNMNDNAALSSAPQIVSKRGVVTPADGKYELTPRKQWWVDENADINDVRMAFMAIEIPTRQNELMNYIEFALRIAEDVTGFPMIAQGNQGSAPETVGGMQILNNNTNTVLKRIVKQCDDYIITRHIRRYYEWIMLYGEEHEKGDFVIDARASTSLIDRDIQQRGILGMGQLVLDPRFKLSPSRWAEEMLRANKIDPKTIKLTDEEIAAEEQAQQQQMAMQQEQMQTAQAEKQARLDQEKEIKGAEIQKDLLIAESKRPPVYSA